MTDMSPARWLSEMGMEDPALVHQCQMINSLEGSDHELTSLSSETYLSHPSFYLRTTSTETYQAGTERPAKLLKTNHTNSRRDRKAINPKASSSSSSNLISFANSNLTDETMYGKLDFGETQRAVRTPVQAKDHVIAERKRRERLSQRFIALSALLPGLKKLDKASVLGDAIKYIGQLKEQIKTLEEERRENRVQSVVCVKKYWLSLEDDSPSSDENFGGSFSQVLPDIELRVSENHVLIRIHCEKHNAVVGKIFSEVEKLHLVIINSSIMPFGHSTLAVNIIAQMVVQFSTTAEDLWRSLRSALQK